MAAVDELLVALGDIEEAMDVLTSSASGPPSSNAISVLERGVAIAGLIAVEEFIRTRAVEWASAVTAARLSPSGFPESGMPLQQRIVEVLPRTFRDADPSSRASLTSSLASTLASAAGGPVVAHQLFFGWSGSNLKEADVASMLHAVGVEKDWSQATAIWQKMDPRWPSATSAKSLITDVTALRHDAAHNRTRLYGLLSHQSLTKNARLSAMVIDATVSLALHAICNGESPKDIGSRATVRRVVRDGTRWPEYSPSSPNRAFRRHLTRDVAIRDATRRARATGELLVVLDGNDILNWATPL